MAQIIGGNNPNNTAHVDNKGRLEAHAISSTEQDYSATVGEAFNLNTSLQTLTNGAETPLFYIKNNSEEREIKISRLFLSALSSTGGAGVIVCNIYKNITGGTILTNTELELTNFNFGSGKTIGAIANLGGTNITFTGGTKTNIELVFPSDGFRSLTDFETIIIPRGASMLFTITPPSGNTSMVVAAGANAFIGI